MIKLFNLKFDAQKELNFVMNYVFLLGAVFIFVRGR